MKHSVVKYIYQMFQIFPQTKGELHPERKDAFEKAQKAYEKLLANTSSLAVSIFDHNTPDVFFFCIDINSSVDPYTSVLILPS